MKHLYTIVIILITACLHTQTSAQNCAPKGISTDPVAPANPDPNGRINTFNYTATGWPLRTEYLQSDTYKSSPFYSDNNAAIEHFYAPNDGVLDMLPANGWEIIKQDFGFLDNGQPSPEKAKNPFIVLYNRYLGKLRVFVARYSTQNFNGANITVRFSSDSPMQTSLLDLGTDIKALDDVFKWNQNFTSVVSFPSGPYEWFYADFQTTYDVCTCYFVSKLNVALTLSNTSMITLTGTSNGTITPIEGGAPSADQQKKGPLSFGDLTSGVKAGIQGYKDGEEVKKDILDAITKKTNNNEVTATTSANMKTGLTNLVNALSSNKFVKLGINAIPYAQAALSVVKLFNGGGKEAPQQVTITPMAIRQSYEFSGTINNDFQNYTTITFRTPGSKVANSPLSQYPYYDEVLGVFNLLKTPKVNKRVDREGTRDEVLYTATFTLSEDIEYVLNPAAKVSIQELQLYGLMKDQNGKESMKSFTGSKFTHVYSGTPTSQSPQLVGFFVIVNLKRLNATDNTQNILLSMRYPFTMTTTIVKPNATRIHATAQTIDSFCNGTYRNSLRFTSNYARTSLATEDELSKLPMDLSVDVFPNKTTGIFNLEYSVASAGQVQIQVVDFMGRTIETFYSNSSEPGRRVEQYDLTGKAKGIYMIIIKTAVESKSTRLVVE